MKKSASIASINGVISIPDVVAAFTSFDLSLMKSFFVLLSIFTITSCSENTELSSASVKLTNDIVPQIEKWSHGKDKSFDLRNKLNRYSLGTICLIQESSSIKRSLKRNNLIVNKTYSKFGDFVGEYQTALVIVYRGNAHASIFHDKSLNFSMPNWTPCASINRAIFVKKKISRLPNNIIELVTVGGNVK